eukprot:8367423-Heterocapsa_arctica.AAC.1
MEDGTRITSINLSGSQADFEYMLEQAWHTTKDGKEFGRLMLKSEFEADHRIVGATLGWGRRK